MNTVPIQLASKIGRQSIIDTAKLAGIRTQILSVPSMPLGTNEVTVLDLTTAYATFANGGKAVSPYAVLEIRRPNGDLLFDRAKNVPPAPQIFDPINVADLNYMLNQVITQGTGRRAQLGFTPQAGKTGTTQDYRDAWFMGFTAQYVTGVWFGNDDYSPMKKITGGNLPAMAWKQYMEKALETQVAEPLPGVPLDNSYAAFVARRESEGQKLPAALADDSGRPRSTTRAAPKVATVATPPPQVRVQQQQAAPVANVFQRMFGNIFGNRNAQPAPVPQQRGGSNFQSRYGTN